MTRAQYSFGSKFETPLKNSISRFIARTSGSRAILADSNRAPTVTFEDVYLFTAWAISTGIDVEEMVLTKESTAGISVERLENRWKNLSL